MKIKNVVLIPNKAKDCDGSYTEQVSNIFTSRGCRVEIGNITPMTDLAVVLGGDGSMLRAARNASARGIPLLGINLGRVGYMTETEIGDLGVLDRLFDGDYRIESRMMLDVIVPDERYGTRRLVALNDAVLASGVVTKMIDIGVDVDGLSCLPLLCGRHHRCHTDRLYRLFALGGRSGHRPCGALHIGHPGVRTLAYRKTDDILL